MGSDTRDFRLDPRLETGYHLRSGARDPRPETLKMGPKTRDAGPSQGWYQGPETGDS